MLFLSLFLCIAPCLFSMDWPSQTGEIIKNFGWNDGGLPHLGISFEDEGSLASAEDGELLYSREEGDTASRLPSPLGSWIALDHGDGIVSIYSRFNMKTSLPGGNRIIKGTILGDSGITGWSSNRGFYFQLFDRKEKRWINPTLIIAAPANERSPQIASVRLKDAQGQIFDLSQQRNLSQGRYLVYVDAIDTSRNQNDRPLAPYRIICTLNGSEAGVLNFETYSSRNGVLTVYRNGLIPVKQVYAPAPAYEAAEVWLSRGQTTLEIIVQNTQGALRSLVYRFMVE